MGKAFRADEFVIKLFSEEVLRGSLFFCLSMILKKIIPHIRKYAHFGDWLIISEGRSHGSRGYVQKIHKLNDIINENF